MTNRIIARVAPFVVVLAVASLAVGLYLHDVGAVISAVVSVTFGIFAWIGAS